MRDADKTKVELIDELAAARQQNTEVHTSDTEQVREMAELHGSISLSASIIDLADEVIISTDENQRIIAFNSAAEQTFGYLKNEVIDQPLELLIPERFQTVHHRHVTEFAHSSTTSQHLSERAEITGRRKDGEEFPAEASILQQDVRGQKVFTVILHDITARKQAEQKLEHYAGQLEQKVVKRDELLQHARERVEAILKSSGDAILVTEPDGTILQTNPAFSKQFHYLIDETLGRSLATLIQPDEGVLIQALHRVIEQQQSVWIEVVARRKDGTTFDADLALSPIGNGTKWGVVCILRDITVRKQLENSLRAALEKEKELNEVRSRFTTLISHEFRTPLSVIQSASDLLKRYGNRIPDERKLEHLNQIQLQVRHMVELLEDILTISKAQTVGLEFHARPTDLESLCREIVMEFQQVISDHEIVFLHSGDCQRPMMDSKLMRQAIGNLLSNAIKYSPQGGRVQIDLLCDQEQATIRIRDEGMGIPEADQKHLFEPFHRAKNADNIPGTGVGLTIVRLVVELHGGTIVCESRVEVGTTFTVRLPLHYS